MLLIHKLREMTSPIRSFLLFGGAWVAVNILQALFTEIGQDEAYYWLYSQHLDWGYYDHPPMVALLIRMGTALWGDTLLGVRFMTIVLQVGFLGIVYRLCGTGNSLSSVRHFFIIAASVVMLQAYGFVTTPDVPLLFFSALFLLTYKWFIDKERLLPAIAMGVSMALLMYSKYHGAIVIIAVLASHLRLLKSRLFWVAVGVALLLFAPHIWWQVSHGFPSLKYHLVARVTPFKWGRFGDFLANQLPVFNPVTIGATIYLLWKARYTDRFERALLYMLIGVWGFFLLYNFKGRIEPHWTVVCAIPMVVLLTRRCEVDPKLSRYTYRVILPSLLLIAVARLFLMIDLLPVRTEWHGGKEKIAAVRSLTQGLPVIYLNQFQDPSRYRFYTGGEAHCIGTVDYRHTQYDFWRFDEAYRGRPVWVYLPWQSSAGAVYNVGKQEFRLQRIEYYRPYKGIVVKAVPAAALADLRAGRRYTLEARLTNTYTMPYTLDHSDMPLGVYLYVDLWQGGARVRQTIPVTCSLDPQQILLAGEGVDCTLSFTLPKELSGGEGRALLAVAPEGYSPATYAAPVPIIIR